MEDFEFSVDISDRDWQNFFSQCEECNVLPPSLAGLEDSGMSDMDDLGALLAKRVHKSDLSAVLLEEDEPACSPCEDPPEELYLATRSPAGVESVLSGSEEDVHLQSVNLFFELMKSSSDSTRTGEQGQVGAAPNRAVKGELRGGGLSAKCSDCALAKNSPHFHSGSSRSGAAAGMKTTEPVRSSIRNTFSVRTDESSSESSTSLYIRHPYLKTQLYIESSAENTANEADRSAPRSNKVLPMGKPTRLCKVKDYSDYQKSSDLSINPGPVVNGKWKEDKSTQVSHSDTDSTHKSLSKESSPCASVKRKRRKKRRLCVEPAENLFTCERLYDSEDELFTWRRAIDPCFCNWSGLKHQHVKCGFMPPLGQYTLSSSLPAGVEATESKPHHSQYQSVLKQANFDPIGLTKVFSDVETKTNGGIADNKEISKVKKEIHLESDSLCPSSKSNDRVAIGQNDRGSTAKSVIVREEADTKQVSPCQRETEIYQQLETWSPIAYQSCHMVENMTPAPSKSSNSTVTDPLDHKARHHSPQSFDTAAEEASSASHSPCLKPCDLTRDDDDTVQKHECLVENDLNNVDLSPKCEAAHDSGDGNLTACESTDQISELQAPLSETEPRPNENISQTLQCFALSQSSPSLSEESTENISNDGKNDAVLTSEVQHLSNDTEKQCWDEVEFAKTNCESEELTQAVKPEHNFFAMSSFWKEMEKLTINDILGLRKETKSQSSFLPSLEESDVSDCLTLSDSGCCVQAQEGSKDGQPTVPDPAECNFRCGEQSVLWENEPVPVHLPPENNDNDIPGPLISPDVPRGVRRMSKSITVQNLCSLESDTFSYNSQSTLKLLDDGNDVGYIPEDPVPAGDPKHSSVIESFICSFSDLYSYFFTDKQPASRLEPPIDQMIDNFTVGETYDHFFAFHTGAFFYTEEAKPELVPIFSCSKTKFKFGDAYDYFLLSSSDSSSSDESDGEDGAPIRVVTRFTRKASSRDLATDSYENFYTDRDLKQDFFKTTFSFRKLKLNGNNAPKNTSTNAMADRPLKEESRVFHLKAMPITVLGNQDFMCNIDEQIITKLQQPLMYENLQTAFANPNVDTPLLPLKQSDMCLICIAFASWVLKTANPQAGDAWKAVLLANVSALSAIRYLRKYVKGESTSGEKKSKLKALTSA